MTQENGDKHLGKIPTVDAAVFLIDAKENGFDGFYRSVLDTDNHRHSHIWQIKFPPMGDAFFIGWKCGRIAGRSS